MLTIQIALAFFSILTIILIIVFRPRPNSNLYALNTKLDDLFKRLDLLTANLRDDFKASREETADTAAKGRQELAETLNSFRREMTETLRLITDQNKTGIEAVNKT